MPWLAPLLKVIKRAIFSHKLRKKFNCQFLDIDHCLKNLMKKQACFFHCYQYHICYMLSVTYSFAL